MKASDLDDLIRRRERDIIYLKKARVDVKDKTLYEIAQELKIDQYVHIEKLYDGELSLSAVQETLSELLSVFNSLHKSDYFVHYEFIVYNRNGSNLCTSNPADLMDCEFVKFIGKPSKTFMDVYDSKFADNVTHYFTENSNI